MNIENVEKKLLYRDMFTVRKIHHLFPIWSFWNMIFAICLIVSIPDYYFVWHRFYPKKISSRKLFKILYLKNCPIWKLERIILFSVPTVFIRDFSPKKKKLHVNKDKEYKISYLWPKHLGHKYDILYSLWHSPFYNIKNCPHCLKITRICQSVRSNFESSSTPEKICQFLLCVYSIQGCTVANILKSACPPITLTEYYFVALKQKREKKNTFICREGFSRPNALQNSEVVKKLLARGKTRESR